MAPCGLLPESSARDGGTDLPEAQAESCRQEYGLKAETVSDGHASLADSIDAWLEVGHSKKGQV